MNNLKKLISIFLFSLILTSLFAFSVSAQENESGSDSKLVDVPSGYNLFEFSKLYKDGKLTIQTNDSAATVTESEKNGGIILSGKPSEISKLTIDFTDDIDLGDYTAGRLVINSLYELKYPSNVAAHFDNDEAKTTSVSGAKQTRSGKWVGEKNYCADVSSLKLSGKHSLRLSIVFNDGVADKKTSVMLKNMLFIAYSLPVVDVDIDESLGSIDAMNADKYHQTECYGNMSISVPEGYKSEYTDEKVESGKYELESIRGRGNSTWDTDKKPYKVKLKKKASLLGMGANKHWGLIANYFDYSLLRNKYTYWLGTKMNMEFTPKCVFVDVIMNGSYLGSYCLSELIRVDESRVNIDNLEDTPEVADGDELTGGYLLNLSGEENASFIKTENNNTYNVESPDFTENYVEAQYNYISNYIKKTEEAIYSNNLCDCDGKSYTNYIDVDAMIDYYIVQGTSDNGDAFVNGSTYLYKKRSGKLYWGPLWDFDYVAWWATDFTVDTIRDSYQIDLFPWIGELLKKDSSFKEKYITRMKEFDDVIRQSAQDGGQIDVFAKQLYLSQHANHILRPSAADGYADENGTPYTVTYDNEIARFKRCLIKRVDWQDNNTNSILDAFDERKFMFMVDNEEFLTLDAEGMKNYEFDNEKPVKKDFIFENWYTTVDETGEVNVFNYIDEYMKNDSSEVINFYAKWEDNSEEQTAILNKNNLNLKAGKTFTLKSDVMKVESWFSGNPKVAAVKDGKVTALKKGKATIYAVLGSHIYDTCKVNVKTSPKLSKKSITVKKNKTKTVKITGKASSVKNVYTNTKKAKIISKNTAASIKIKGLKKGSTTLKIKVNGVVLKLKVKVK